MTDTGGARGEASGNTTGGGDAAAASVDGALAAASGVRFGPMNSITVSNIGMPLGIALGDLNGDGRTDIVVANLEYPANRPDVLVFLQGGDGSFPASPVTYTFGAAPVAVADVNGDGRSDLLAGSSSAIAIALQASDGTLASAVTYALPAALQPFLPEDIVTGDFNVDGRTDVVVACSAGSVFLYLQDTSGGLGSPQTLITLGGPSAQVGDFNGDGLPDLITVGPSGVGSATSVGVLPLKSPGVFGSALEANHAGASLGGGFDVGDVTGDGKLDVVTAVASNRPQAKLLVSRQDQGLLVGPDSYDSLDIPGPVRVADVDMDGRLDAVVQHAGWFGVGVYLQKSDGTLAPEVVLKSSYGQSNLAVGDINGDGKPDIATADQQRLVIFYNEH